MTGPLVTRISEYVNVWRFDSVRYPITIEMAYGDTITGRKNNVALSIEDVHALRDYLNAQYPAPKEDDEEVD